MDAQSSLGTNNTGIIQSIPRPDILDCDEYRMQLKSKGPSIRDTIANKKNMVNAYQSKMS